MLNVISSMDLDVDTNFFLALSNRTDCKYSSGVSPTAVLNLRIKVRELVLSCWASSLIEIFV